MERISISPRRDYQTKIEALGFDFHGSYWREEAYYRLSPEETERLETATVEAYRMYCDAAQYIIEEKPEFMERILNLPPEIIERIRQSWNDDELSLYGRFDFMFDEDGTPKILEFNADSPTSGNGKKMYSRSSTNITASMKGWYNRGKTSSRKAVTYILPEHWKNRKIRVRYNTLPVRQWKPVSPRACWISTHLTFKTGSLPTLRGNW